MGKEKSGDKVDPDWFYGTQSEIEWDKEHPFDERDDEGSVEERQTSEEDDRQEEESADDSEPDDTENDMLEHVPLHIVKRTDWCADPPTEQIPPLSHPIQKVSFHYDTGTDECYNIQQCERMVYEIQRRQMGEGYPDIHYNFLVGNDGNVYEGRGWHLKPEIANKYPACEDYTLDIAFIGFFETCPHDLHMQLAAEQLCDYGVEQELIHKKFTYVGFMEKEVDYSKLGGIPKLVTH